MRLKYRYNRYYYIIGTAMRRWVRYYCCTFHVNCTTHTHILWYHIQSNETNTVCTYSIINSWSNRAARHSVQWETYFVCNFTFSITQRTTVGRTKALSERVEKKCIIILIIRPLEKKEKRITGADPSCSGESMMEMKNSVRIRPGRYDRYT